jgi:hypothetical protein
LCEVIYSPVSALIRTSISVFLLRIAQTRLHRWVICITMAAVWTFSVVYFVLVLMQCSPTSFFWRQVLGTDEGHCIDPGIIPAATIAQSVVGAVCDFALALLPAAMLWKVQLNVRTKITVAVLLGMGIL